MNWIVGTIIVPSDGSADAEAELASARALARAAGARIVVVHVNELVRGHLGVHSLHPCEDHLKASVRTQFEELRQAGVRAELELVASAGDLAQVIIDVARRRDADLIVTRQGRSRSALGLMSGSVARRLIRLAPCPVLVVPRPAQPPAPRIGSGALVADQRSLTSAGAGV